MNIAQRILAARAALGLNQTDFAEHLGGYSRSYISQLELGKHAGGSKKLLRHLEAIEAEARVRSLNKPAEAYSSRPVLREEPPGNISNVDSEPLVVRLVPQYSYVKAGSVDDFEELPSDWQEQVPYFGTDPKAFGLRIEGDSMEPRHYAGDVVIVSPQYPPSNGDKVVARVRGQGVVFKIMHHSGDGKQITLSSYNPLYKELVFPREDFHWIYPVVSITQFTKQR